MATVEVDVDVLEQLLCDHRDLTMLSNGFSYRELLPREHEPVTMEQQRALRRAILIARRAS